MITLYLTNGDAVLVACAAAVNFALGIYVMLAVLDILRQSTSIRLSTAIVLGIASACPPTLLVLAVARLGHII